MNTKIIVALVIGIALIGLTGVVSASLYDGHLSQINTQTEITGTHFTSESEILVSGMQTTYARESLLVAELVYPTYPEVDMAWSATLIEGSNYGVSTSIVSSPTGSQDEYEISNPSTVEGYTTFFNCAMLGAGIPQTTVTFPDDREMNFIWYSLHGEGDAYPASLSQSTNIYWP